jgi:tetratricopeptide (TPR) repeat protein
MPIRTPRGPCPLARRCRDVIAPVRFDRTGTRLGSFVAGCLLTFGALLIRVPAHADTPAPADSGSATATSPASVSSTAMTVAPGPANSAGAASTPATANPAIPSGAAPRRLAIEMPVTSPTAARATARPSTTTAGAGPIEPPADLHDLDAWIGYRSHAQIPMLPSEARLFYRRGLIALKSGQDAEGVRLLRGAGTLDPTFLSPHAMLASWFFTREPSTALQECAAALQLLRRDFLLQLDLAANAVFYLLTVLFLGLVGAGVLTVAAHHAPLRHMWQERFGRHLTPTTARLWPWLVLALSFLVGLGLAMPVLVFLGMLWPVLRAKERFLTLTLAFAVAIAPFAPILIGRLALPLHGDSAPFFGVASIEHDPWTPEQQRRLTELTGSVPANPFVQFGLGWSARRGEDLATAEAAYRRVLEHWPNDDRTLVNLGNILAVQGRFDEALTLYHRAVKSRPDNAAAWFNQSQVYTRLFDFRNASESVSRASALDFDLVQRLQGASVGGALPLADQWIAPLTFWKAMRSALAARAAEPAIPPAWRGTIEVTTGWFGPLALALMLAGIALGYAWQRGLPLRNCSNCGAVVCRRCSERRREVALCPGCAEVESRAESADFARVLLDQQRRRVEHRRRTVRTALASLIPGFGSASFHDVFSTLSMVMLVAWLGLVALGVNPPFDTRHDFGLAGPGVPVPVIFTLWVTAYGLSILRFVTRQAKIDAQLGIGPIKSRVTQTTHRRAEAA